MPTIKITKEAMQTALEAKSWKGVLSVLPRENFPSNFTRINRVQSYVDFRTGEIHLYDVNGIYIRIIEGKESARRICEPTSSPKEAVFETTPKGEPLELHGVFFHENVKNQTLQVNETTLKKGDSTSWTYPMYQNCAGNNSRTITYLGHGEVQWIDAKGEGCESEVAIVDIYIRRIA